MNIINEMSSCDLTDRLLAVHQIWVCLKEAWLVWLAIHSYVEKGSLVSHDKYDRFNLARNGDLIGIVIDVWYTGGT